MTCSADVGVANLSESQKTILTTEKEPSGPKPPQIIGQSAADGGIDPD